VVVSADVIFLCLLAMLIIFGALAWFAFSEPLAYIRWVSPLYWITRHQLKINPGRFDRMIAFSFGSFFLFGTIVISFFLGGWITTAFFHLQLSPFSRLVFP
jgi:hypothetical protein